MAAVRYREQYRKPVIYDECKYEGNVPQGWGNLSGREMTQRFWLGTMSGCYVGHGETYLNDDEILWWSKGGQLHGESPQRIQWLKEFMAVGTIVRSAATAGQRSRPVSCWQSRDQYYLMYVLGGNSQTIDLARQPVRTRSTRSIRGR